MRRHREEGLNVDEDERPDLLQRPLFARTVAVSVAVLVIGWLVVRGSGGPGGTQDRASGSGDEAPPPSAGVPRGAVLIKNARYGFCVDLPGKGKGRPDGRVQDDPGCEAS